MTDLKPCPFCGFRLPTRVFDFDRRIGWVHCEPGFGGCGGKSGVCGEEELVVKLWNTRHEPRPTEEESEGAE